jgi:ABC-type nitrate/sulfonate/bicarbonate transport system permease component
VSAAVANARSLDARHLVGPAGLVGILLLWWLLAETVFSASGSVPTPWAVVDEMASDGWEFYGPNLRATVASATKGFLWGNGLAVAVAMLVVLAPRLEAVAVQIAVISYCIPLVAIGPIILIVFGGRVPSIFLAAISVFFTTLVGVLLGLRSADPTSLDVVRAYGGGRVEQLRRVQLVSALPASLAALKIAAPAATLGAILGEYLGGVDTGLGVALTIAQQQVQVPRTWGLALAAGLVAGLGYAAIALLARLVAPWAEPESGVGR